MLPRFHGEDVVHFFPDLEAERSSYTRALSHNFVACWRSARNSIALFFASATKFIKRFHQRPKDDPSTARGYALVEIQLLSGFAIELQLTTVIMTCARSAGSAEVVSRT